MLNETSNKDYKKIRLQYQLNRAKEYLADKLPKDGAEPCIEWCIISDLVRIINNQ